MTGTFGRDRAPERACLKAHEWPERDRTFWQAALRTGDLLEPGGERQRYAAISNRKVERGYGRWLTYLATVGQLDRDAAPGDRITGDRVVAYVQALAALGNGTHTILARLQELHEAALIMDPLQQWQWIRRLASKVRARHIPVRDKRARMIGAEELVELGLGLIEGAAAQSTDRQRALAFRDGLLIALLALRPAMRRRNLAALELDRHLCRIGDTWIVAFAGDETKTGAALEFPWPEILVPALQRWLDHWRPMLLGFTGRWTRPAGNALWVSSHGSAMTEQAIYDRVTERTRDAFGKSINPHIFRDCAATTLAYADPKHAGIAAPLLGHRSFATTQRHYLRARMAEASLRLQQEDSYAFAIGQGAGCLGRCSMRAIVYARFSSQNQREASIGDQIEVCRRYLHKQGWTLVQTYTDAAISGSSRFRPGYQKLLTDLHAGVFDVVVVEALDRLGRKLADVADLHDRCAFVGVRLFAVNVGEITAMHVGLLGTMVRIPVNVISHSG